MNRIELLDIKFFSSNNEYITDCKYGSLIFFESDFLNGFKKVEDIKDISKYREEIKDKRYTLSFNIDSKEYELLSQYIGSIYNMKPFNLEFRLCANDEMMFENSRIEHILPINKLDYDNNIGVLKITYINLANTFYIKK